MLMMEKMDIFCYIFSIYITGNKYQLMVQKGSLHKKPRWRLLQNIFEFLPEKWQKYKV